MHQVSLSRRRASRSRLVVQSALRRMHLPQTHFCYVHDATCHPRRDRVSKNFARQSGATVFRRTGMMRTRAFSCPLIQRPPFGWRRMRLGGAVCWPRVERSQRRSERGQRRCRRQRQSKRPARRGALRWRAWRRRRRREREERRRQRREGDGHHTHTHRKPRTRQRAPELGHGPPPARAGDWGSDVRGARPQSIKSRPPPPDQPTNPDIRVGTQSVRPPLEQNADFALVTAFRAPCGAMAKWHRRACFRTRRGGRGEHCEPCAATSGAPTAVNRERAKTKEICFLAGLCLL